MKKVVFISAAVLIALSACERERHVPKCPVVAEASIPKAVTTAFYAKYDGTFESASHITKVEKWFNKDNKAYAALFMHGGKKTLSFFDNNGNFEQEQGFQGDQQGEHQDGDDEGCECREGDGD